MEISADLPNSPQRSKAFCKTIVSANKSLREGCVIVEQVIFDPKHVNELMAKYTLSRPSDRHWSTTATGCEEAVELLEASFADSIDFIFVPAPKQFVIYADHDEYATFYANTKSNLNSITEPLSQTGFKNATNYTRHLQQWPVGLPLRPDEPISIRPVSDIANS